MKSNDNENILKKTAENQEFRENAMHYEIFQLLLCLKNSPALPKPPKSLILEIEKKTDYKKFNTMNFNDFARLVNNIRNYLKDECKLSAVLLRKIDTIINKFKIEAKKISNFDEYIDLDQITKLNEIQKYFLNQIIEICNQEFKNRNSTLLKSWNSKVRELGKLLGTQKPFEMKNEPK